MLMSRRRDVNDVAHQALVAVQRRNIKPRTPDPYDNEQHGYDRIGDVARLATSPEDFLDSYALALRHKQLAVPPASNPWFQTDAARKLAEMPKHKVWVPTWVTLAAGHPARATLLSWLLSCFSACKESDQDGLPLCRARCLDESERRWWRATRKQIVDETLLDDAAADRARRALVRHGFIEVISQSRGLLLRPLFRPVAEAFYKRSGDDEVLDELKNVPDDFEWFGSHSRVRSELARHGTELDAALMIICERRPGPALVLAHVLYWHGQSADGRSRARVLRDSHLWIARSQRQLASNPGGDPSAMSRYVQWLSDHSLLVAESRRWRWLSARDQGQPTLHLRPNPSGIEAALARHAAEINAVNSHARNGSVSPTRKENDGQIQELPGQLEG